MRGLSRRFQIVAGGSRDFKGSQGFPGDCRDLQGPPLQRHKYYFEGENISCRVLSNSRILGEIEISYEIIRLD